MLQKRGEAGQNEFVFLTWQVNSASFIQTQSWLEFEITWQVYANKRIIFGIRPEAASKKWSQRD